MLGVRGFWCYEETSGKDVGWGSCLRRETLCKTTRDKVTKEGIQATECAFAERARCFDFEFQIHQQIAYRCVPLAGDCERDRRAFASKYPDALLSECEITE